MLTKLFTNRDKSNASEYNRLVWCDVCQHKVRQGGHAGRCKPPGNNRRARRASKLSSDSGYGSSGGRMAKADKAEVKKFITNQAAIKRDVVESYCVAGVSGEKSRNNLYAFIIPMGCGKTTLSKKYGFIDVDSCGTSLSNVDGIAGCVREMVSKRDWAKSMKRFAKEVERTMDAMAFPQKTLLMVHDETMARYIGAEVIGGCYLHKEGLQKANPGRSKMQMAFADINNEIVQHGEIECDSLTDVAQVEELVLLTCTHFGIMHGAPGSTDLGAPGYMTKNEEILTGQTVSLEALKALYQKVKIPQECVYYQMNKQGIKEYCGMGGCANEIAQCLAKADIHNEQLHDRLASLKQYVDFEKDQSINLLMQKFGDSPGYLTRIISHWVVVGSICDYPELMFRLYQVGPSRWRAVFKALGSYLTKTRFWCGRQLSVKMCDAIMDMRFLMSGKPMAISNAIGKSHTVVADMRELESIVTSCDRQSVLQLDESKFTLLYDTMKGMNAEQANYISGGKAQVSEGDLEELSLQQIVSCILLSHHDPFESADGLWRSGRCDASDAGQEWVDVLDKLNKLSGPIRVQAGELIATMLHQRVSVDADGSLSDFLKCIQELVTYGKVCGISSREYGQPANVCIVGGSGGYCTTSIDSDKWMNYASQLRLDFANVLWMSSRDRMIIERLRGMRMMAASTCLAIKDLIAADLTQKEYLAQCAHLTELAQGEGVTAIMNSFGKVKHTTEGYESMRRVMFTSTKDGGMGFRLPRGQVFRSSVQASYVGAEKKLPSPVYFRPSKKKAEGSEPEGMLTICWDQGDQDAVVSIKNVAEVGLSCGLFITEHCGNTEQARKVVRW